MNDLIQKNMAPPVSTKTKDCKRGSGPVGHSKDCSRRGNEEDTKGLG